MNISKIINRVHSYNSSGNFLSSYKLLRPLYLKNRDNIHIQKLFAYICDQLNRPLEGIYALENILLYYPRDKEALYLIKKLKSKVCFDDESLEQYENPVDSLEFDISNYERQWVCLNSGDNIDISGNTRVKNKLSLTHILVDSCIKNGDLDNAEEILNRLLNINSDDKAARDKLEEIKRIKSSKVDNCSYDEVSDRLWAFYKSIENKAYLLELGE